MRGGELILESLRQDQVLRQLALSESGFLFDPRSGQSFSLNATAVEVLELLRQGLNLQQVAHSLCQSYLVSPDQAEVSVESFLLQLSRHLS